MTRKEMEGGKVDEDEDGDEDDDEGGRGGELCAKYTESG